MEYRGDILSFDSGSKVFGAGSDTLREGFPDVIIFLQGLLQGSLLTIHCKNGHCESYVSADEDNVTFENVAS